jgi:pimeloyl-ACP methyl ester carboxylesterase
MKTLLFCLAVLAAPHAKALKPATAYLLTPDSLGLSYETLDIWSGDSTARLKAWKMLPAPAYDRKTTIILGTGDAGNMSYLLQQAYMLVGNGFTVITFDYRGFGESSSFSINEKFLYYNEFSKDLEGIIIWARANIPGNKTGMLTFSMSTAIVAMAVQNQPLDFIITEGLIYNPFVVSIRIKTGKNQEVFLPEHAEELPGLYEKITCPILLFSGSLDMITTPADSKTVSKQAKNRKLITFKGGHFQGFEALAKKNYGDKYIEAVIKFTGI